MSLSRRFLNVIMNDSVPGTRSLRRIDLTRGDFFYPGAPPPPPSTASAMEQIRLPSPAMRFKASGVSCLPLSDGKVLCRGRCEDVVLDADTRHVVTVPAVDKPRWKPISVFVPSADGSADPDADPEGSLFVMERRPKHEGESMLKPSHQFEAFVRRRSSKTSPSESWQRELLRPPPYLRDRKYTKYRSEISSYAVVGGGSHVCVSIDGATTCYCSFTATYCLDTVKHTWSKVGEWELPFDGKAEYVPELKLWFGLLDGTRTLGAVDLSAMDSEPSLVSTWDLDDDDDDAPSLESDETLKEWSEGNFQQLVHLGSGRFIVASSVHTMGSVKTSLGTELTSKRFAVLTGVEVTPPVDGHGELQLVKHKLKRTSDGTLFDLVF